MQSSSHWETDGGIEGRLSDIKDRWIIDPPEWGSVEFECNLHNHAQQDIRWLAKELKACHESINLGGIERRIRGGLIATINAHGPITMKLVGSAEKRLVGDIASYVRYLKRRADELEQDVKSSAKMRDVLEAIRDYEPDEICYDQFAYERLRDSYREAARRGLGEP